LALLYILGVKKSTHNTINNVFTLCYIFVEVIVVKANADKYVSIVSAWEFTAKHSLGKLDLDGGISGFFQILDENGFNILGVERVYVHQLAHLPIIHHDPFDRMLISTALAEEMRLATADQNIRKYDVAQVWQRPLIIGINFETTQT